MHVATLLTTLLLISSLASSYQLSSDLLCNNGSVHACVCNRIIGDLDDFYLQCDLFLQVLELAVVAITIRHVNLESRLYTGESYQTYFKRRIAAIISTYCEHQAHECPGTTLRLFKDNVAILHVDYGEHNETTIRFVVTKSPNVGSLTELLVMDPMKVKTILTAQLAPLSRVLGGIHIDRIAVSSIKRSSVPPELDNTRLNVLLTIVLCFFAICYTIAIVKCCSVWRKKRRLAAPRLLLDCNSTFHHSNSF